MKYAIPLETIQQFLVKLYRHLLYDQDYSHKRNENICQDHSLCWKFWIALSIIAPTCKFRLMSSCAWWHIIIHSTSPLFLIRKKRGGGGGKRLWLTIRGGKKAVQANICRTSVLLPFLVVTEWGQINVHSSSSTWSQSLMPKDGSLVKRVTGSL